MNRFRLYEWQTFYRLWRQRCHSERSTFPSSRSLDILSNHICVNVPFTPIDMNEVTMRSVLATHSTGMSWRDLHKITTYLICHHQFKPFLLDMPFAWRMLLKVQLKFSMLEAGDQLLEKVDSEPCPEPEAVNVPISFDSSSKTRGYYSNIGFGAAISTPTKKYWIMRYFLSSICDKCSI